MTVPKYIISRLLFVSFILTSSYSFSDTLNNNYVDCSALKASISIDEATNVVKINVEGIQGIKRMHLIKDDGFAKRDISESDLTNLESGKYTVVIIDQRKAANDFCQKYFEFTIK